MPICIGSRDHSLLYIDARIGQCRSKRSLEARFDDPIHWFGEHDDAFWLAASNFTRIINGIDEVGIPGHVRRQPKRRSALTNRIITRRDDGATDVVSQCEKRSNQMAAPGETGQIEGFSTEPGLQRIERSVHQVDFAGPSTLQVTTCRAKYSRPRQIDQGPTCGGRVEVHLTLHQVRRQLLVERCHAPERRFAVGRCQMNHIAFQEDQGRSFLCSCLSPVEAQTIVAPLDRNQNLMCTTAIAGWAPLKNVICREWHLVH